MKIQILVGVILILIVLSACGGEKSNQEQSNIISEKKKACDLLTLNDLQDVTGQPFEMGISHSEYDCGYVAVEKNENGTAKNQVYVRITEPFYNLSPKEAMSRHVKMMKEGLGKDSTGYEYEEVAGVGDLAIWDRSSSTNRSVQLVIFKAVSSGGKSGIIMVTIQLVDFEKEIGQQYAKSLASKALQRL